jgi:hypothetical protein
MSPSDEAVCDSTARRGDPRSEGHALPSAPSYSFELQFFFLIPPFVPPMTCTCPTSSEILQSECPSIFSLSSHYTPTFEHVCLPNLERLQMRRLPEIAVRDVGSRIMDAQLGQCWRGCRCEERGMRNAVVRLVHGLRVLAEILESGCPSIFTLSVTEYRLLRIFACGGLLFRDPGGDAPVSILLAR